MTKQVPDPAETPDLPFEEAYHTIEEIVEKLESGESSLAESVALFERGQKLLALCSAQLDAAELRVSQLSIDNDGNLKTDSMP